MYRLLCKLVLKISKIIHLDHIIPDGIFLKLTYRSVLNEKLHLNNPKTYNEKLQYLKLHDRQSIYNTLVDKYLVKDYVAKIVGEKYIIPTIGVWENFDEIDFNKLPNRFVLKCTHDSGGSVICKDKRFFDKNKANKILSSCLKRNYFWLGREWPYKDLKPRIIAEEYIEDDKNHELSDYKFFCFNGKCRLIFVGTGRQSGNLCFDFFDENFNHLNIISGHKNASFKIEKPKKIDEMIKIAELLSHNIPHVRIDLYYANNNVYFGEFTFYHWSGFVKYKPDEWNNIMGDWIEMPK